MSFNSKIIFHLKKLILYQKLNFYSKKILTHKKEEILTPKPNPTLPEIKNSCLTKEIVGTRFLNLTPFNIPNWYSKHPTLVLIISLMIKLFIT